MQKRVFTVLLCLLLIACQDPLLKLGYSEEDIALISELSEENQQYFIDEYNEKYLNLIKDPSFNEAKMDTYLQYLDVFEGEDLFVLVDHFTSAQLDELAKYYEDDYFILDKAEDYLRYPQSSVRETVEYVNTLRYQKAYVDVEKADLDKDIYILVNKYHYLEEDYVPQDLVDIESAYGINGKLRKAAYEAYKQMQDDAKAEGYNFYITSPYRPYTSQKRLYDNYSLTYGQASADTFSARPGYSEHQSGLAVDILSAGYDFDNFDLSKEALWLQENAHNYGFILRYPQDKQDITGYTYEPWHYRYVGDIATDIVNSGLTYDEYYAYYLVDYQGE